MKFAATEWPTTDKDLVVVICFGNPLRGDDGVGRAVASALTARGRPAAAQRLYVVFAQQLTPELALPLSRAAIAIFVDAAADLPPGTVDRHRVTAGGPRGSHALCHHQSIGSVLAFAKHLFGGVPESWAITVGGAQWGYGSELSAPVRAAVGKVLHEIAVIVASGASSTTRRVRRVAVMRGGG